MQNSQNNIIVIFTYSSPASLVGSDSKELTQRSCFFNEKWKEQ